MAGTEEGMVDTRRRRCGCARARPRRARRSGRLRPCTDREDGVGALDDGHLGLGPAVRHVCLHLLGHRLRLDAVEGVERADQRQVQLVLDHVAGEARQPVVGVHRGVGQLAGPGHALEHAHGELVDHGGEGLLGQDLERPGRDVVDPQPGLDVDHGRQIGRPRPGEHVTGHVGAGETRDSQLPHVDVSAAAQSPVPGWARGDV